MDQKVKRFTWPVGICALFLAVLLMPLAGQVGALETYWKGGDGLWSNDSNWDTGLPSTGDRAVLGSYGTVTYDSSATDPYLFELDINASGGKSMVLNHSSGTLTLENNSSLFVNATGSGSYASYDLSGDAVLAKTGYEVKIGTDGTGHFKQSGGSFQFSGALYLGDQATGHGIYTMTGGEIVAGLTGVGGIVLGEWGGTGDFLQSGGKVTIADLTLARQARATGNYTLSGDPSLVTLTVNGPTVVGELGTGTFTQTGGTHTAGSLTLGSSGVNVILNDDTSYNSHTAHQGNGTYNLNASVPADESSNLWVQNDLVLGNGGTGVFHHDNGRVTVDGNLILGRQTIHDVWNGIGDYVTTEYLNGTGTYNLKSGELFVSGNTIIGESENSLGTFNQAGGSHKVEKNLYVDAYAGSKGVYNLSGGSLYVVGDDRAVVGSFGNGEFNQGPDTTPDLVVANDGGVFRVDKHLLLGEQEGSIGTYNLSGGTLDVGWYTTVGYSGAGYFNQSGGSHMIGGGLNLGQTPSGYGEYNLSGDPATSTLTVGSAGTRVGEYGTGVFNQYGGTHTTNGLVLGQSGRGTYNLSGNGSVLSVINNGDIYLGVDGIGLFTQYDNSSVAANNLFIGSSSGNGTYELYGGSLMLTGVTNVGYNGTGTFIQYGGTHDVSLGGGLGIGFGKNGKGTYEMNGGTLKAGWIDVGDYGIGSFAQTDGTVTVAETLVIGRHSKGSEATGYNTYTLSGDVKTSTLTTGGTVVGAFGTGTFTQTGGTHTTGTLVLGYNYNTDSGSGPIGPGNGTYELKGGSLTSDFQRIGLEGAGTFTQTDGTNTVKDTMVIAQEKGCTGTYNFLGGSLNAANIYVNQGGLFKGIGTINGYDGNPVNFVNAGIVAPGSSPGTLTINGNYTQDPLGILEIELGGSGNHDILNITGTADLNGTLKLLLYGDYTTSEVKVGDFFDVLFASEITGGFTINGSATGWTWDVAYLNLTGSDDKLDTVRLTAQAPVPVPPSIWLLGAGLVGLIGLRRKFRK